MRRLLAIGFIWLCCAGAWSVLGSTLAVRSSDVFEGNLAEVQALWGPPLQQAPPSAVGSAGHEDAATHVPMTLARSEVDAGLALEQRRKGLLWYPTYGVTFAGRYSSATTRPRSATW